MKSAMNNVVSPIEFIFINNLNSMCSVIIIFLNIILIRFDIIQYGIGIIIKPITVLIQFNDKFCDVAGSNAENKLVIIFNYFLLLLSLFLILIFYILY
jgi:hypothetical protein